MDAPAGRLSPPEDFQGRIQCIVTDLDGTLLNNSREISRQDRDELKRLQAEGVKIIVATGRSPFFAYRYFEELGACEQAICGNGSVLFDPVAGRVVQSWPIGGDACRQIAEIMLANDVALMLHTPDALFFDGALPNRATDYMRAAERVHCYERPRPIAEINVEEYDQVYKITMFSEHPDRARRLIAASPAVASLRIDVSGNDVADITLQQVSKGAALRYLSEVLSFDLERTIAFGDSENDISMFRTVGFGTAMANSIDALKRVSRYITGSNEESGVCFALHGYYRKMLP